MTARRWLAAYYGLTLLGSVAIGVAIESHSWLLGQIAVWVLIGAGWCLRSWDLAYQAERQAAGIFTRRAPP